MNIKQENDKGKIMNALRIARITNKLIVESCCKYANIIKSFEMTEKEWEKYSEDHPNADKKNHTIIQKKRKYRNTPKPQISIVKNRNWDARWKKTLEMPLEDEIQKIIEKICNSEIGHFQIDKYAFTGIEMALEEYNNIMNEFVNFNVNPQEFARVDELLQSEKIVSNYISQYAETKANIYMDLFSIPDSMQSCSIKIISIDPTYLCSSPNINDIINDITPIVQKVCNSFCGMFSSKYKLINSGTLEVFISDTVDRGDCSKQGKIRVGCYKTTMVCYQTYKTIQDAWRFDVTELVHEFAHIMEDSNPHIRKCCREFLINRTKGETALSLNELWLNDPSTTLEERIKHPNGPYEPDEKAKPDNFFDIYCGKIYSDGATEIFSMGIERLLTEPDLFKQEDPEYFYFIIKLMRGEL